MKLPTAADIPSLDPNDHITVDLRDKLRAYGRANLFFFARYIFGRTGLTERTHKPLCDAAQSVIRTPNGFGVFEDPRATGKSHAITIPGAAWCLIQDPEECRQNGWLPLGPDASVIVASYKTPFAAIFTDMTRRIMEENTIFLWLYGDLIPGFAGSKGATWSKEQFTVVRDGGSGPSVMAIGTESGATSLHPHVVFIDDLINEINFDSPVEVASAVAWVEHSKNLTEIMRGSRLITQNEWTERGVNSAMREANRANPRSVFFFSRSRIVCDSCANGRLLDAYGNPIVCGVGEEHPGENIRPVLEVYPSDPVVPYTMRDVRNLRAGMRQSMWFAQHENNPLAQAELKWREEWVRFYSVDNEEGRHDLVFITGQGGISGASGRVDPERIVRVPVSSLNVVISLDPGLARPGVMAAGRVFVPSLGDMIIILEATTDHLSPQEQFYTMFDWARKWGARKLAFENVGLQAYIATTIPAMAAKYEFEKSVSLPKWMTRPTPNTDRILGIQVYKAEGDKRTRIERAIGPFAEGRLIGCRRDITAFLDEYAIFDKGKYMDCLDAFVMCIKATEGQRPATQAERIVARLAARKSRESFENQMRNSADGYGAGV